MDRKRMVVMMICILLLSTLRTKYYITIHCLFLKSLLVSRTSKRRWGISWWKDITWFPSFKGICSRWSCASCTQPFLKEEFSIWKTVTYEWGNHHHQPVSSSSSTSPQSLCHVLLLWISCFLHHVPFFFVIPLLLRFPTNLYLPIISAFGQGPS